MTSTQPSDALSAAGIASWRRGGERQRAQTDDERLFYHGILRSFRTGAPWGPDELADAASELELDVESTLALLAREDLVHHDAGTGTILVAYPFSGRRTAHNVRFQDGATAFAMCAIDALGIPAMFDEPVSIASSDALTGEEFRVELEPDGRGQWYPQEAVVVSGTTGGGESCDCCCPVLNFFASSANAERWLAAHPAVQGTVISIEEAIVAGRAVFANILKEA